MILFSDYSKTDLHCHLLPGMDHGCTDMKMAEHALKRAQEAGIHTICCTSHFYPNEHHVDAFLEQRTAQMAVLAPVAERYGIRLIPGAEVQVQNDISKCGDLTRLHLEGLDTILIELPFLEPVTHKILDHVYRIMLRSKLQVLIAHPDRYDASIIEECLSFGCVLQLNSDSLTDRAYKKQAAFWIRQDTVFGIGTDFHRDPDGSYDSFRKALKTIQKYN